MSSQADEKIINASKLLFALSKIDGEMLVLTQQKSEILSSRDGLVKEIELLKNSLEQALKSAEECSSRQGGEEEKLRLEQRKIVERRKQLTNLGGTKGAKLVEREIDIAARTLQSMEQKVLQLVEEVEKLREKSNQIRTDLDAKQLVLEESSAGSEDKLQELLGKIRVLDQKRNEVMTGLEDRVKNLYVRVNNRYPGGAISHAGNGACRTCYRALPAQTFNQVLSGSLLIQCPGCSRILVAVDGASQSE